MSTGLSPHDVALERLGSRIIGQPNAVHLMARAAADVDLSEPTEPGRPRGSFLFLGPTGVGKTELGKAFTELVFGSQKFMAKLDMSEYPDVDSLRRFIGEPGKTKGILPREIVRLNRAGGGVLFIDEVEKADPRVYSKLWLNIIEEARVRDADGIQLRLDWLFVIMTANLAGASVARLPAKAPRYMKRERLLNSARDYFGPEGVGRFDEIITFERLSEATQDAICAKLVSDEQARIAKKLTQLAGKLTPPLLSLGPDALRLLRQLGYSEELGARPMRRAVHREMSEAWTQLKARFVSGELCPDDLIAGSAVLGWCVRPRDERAVQAGLPMNCLRLEPIDPGAAGRPVVFAPELALRAA